MAKTKKKTRAKARPTSAWATTMFDDVTARLQELELEFDALKQSSDANACKRELPDALVADEIIWRTGDGEVAVSCMTDEHLINALRWLDGTFKPSNEADKQWRAAWYAVLKLEAVSREHCKFADGLEALP